MSAPVPAEPIRILSDLHFGHSGGKIDSAAQLRPLLEGARTVVFNGDTIEERAGRFRPRSMEMLADLRNLCAELGVAPVFQSGNHDPAFWKMDGIDLAGGSVFATHGHVLLPYISPWSKDIDHSVAAIDRLWTEYSADDLEQLEKRFELTRRSCEAMDVYQPSIKRPLFGRLRTLAAEMWPPHRPIAILKTWSTAHRLAEAFLSEYRPDAKIFVLGHTHLPGIWKVNGKTIINTGGFLVLVNARVVEIDRGRLQVRMVKKRAGEFCFGKTKYETTVPQSKNAGLVGGPETRSEELVGERVE